jgi:hypothetical protein
MFALDFRSLGFEIFGLAVDQTLFIWSSSFETRGVLMHKPISVDSQGASSLCHRHPCWMQ